MSESKSKRFTSVSIPVPLFRKAQLHIAGTGFTSVSSYVAYVLREILSEPKSRVEPFTLEDKQRVLGRLKSLGYLS